jgi:ABC-type Mn2+/Zn2+ transport system ATPase subunit
MESASAMVCVRDLVARYGERVALDRVSLDVRPAEVLALIGPNGGGKSTLLKTIARLNSPASGMVHYAQALGADPRRQIVYVPQRDHLDWALPASVRDLALLGVYHETSRWRPLSRASRARVAWALGKVNLLDRAETQIGYLSGGQQQRVILARALARPGRVYLFDEPFNGVDAPTEAIFEHVIDELRAEGAAIVLATHNLDCARAICDRACVLNRTVVALGPPDAALTPETVAAGFGDFAPLHAARRATNTPLESAAC